MGFLNIYVLKKPIYFCIISCMFLFCILYDNWCYNQYAVAVYCNDICL